MPDNTNNIPKIMGILNVTPDSFFQDSRLDNLLPENFNFNNADILDVGFESSRPGAMPVTEQDEIKRLDYFLHNFHPIHDMLSIDTYKPAVARLALENGFNIINDIKGGGEDGEMLEIASFFNCPIIIMHMKGYPLTMQNKPYYDNIIDELLYYFENKIALAKQIGLSDEQIILDPGIGFGKRVVDNDIIINNISKLKNFGFPVLVGVSRKSFLSVDDDSSEKRLSASLGVSTLAVLNGANIIRTHDIEETYRMLTVINRVQQSRYHSARIS